MSLNKNINPQHWRGVPTTFGPGSPPVLEFSFSAIQCLQANGSQSSARPYQNQQAVCVRRMTARARQHPACTHRHNQIAGPRCAGEKYRKIVQGPHRFPAAERQGICLHRSGSEGRKQEPVSRQSANTQIRKYATSQNCRFVILSNGNLHYLWDLEHSDQ